jgi:3D (Asp-Asp-Asp) domain-containing protein
LAAQRPALRLLESHRVRTIAGGVCFRKEEAMNHFRGACRHGLAGTVALLLLAASCARAPAPVEIPAPEGPPAVAEPKPATLEFEATAYSIKGKTASGATTRAGMVAADPSVLPIGSVIRVHDAGQYSGEYHVADTGPAIKGREIDIYLEKQDEARRFGRRNVRIEVLQYGDGRTKNDGDGARRAAD